MITKPMLAGNKYDSGSAIDTNTELGMIEAKGLTYPLIATPKLDGIRCLVIDGSLIKMEGKQVVSRRYKLIPNRHIRESVAKHYPIGCDGELTVKGTDFSETSGGVMRSTGEPDFEYGVFDYVKDGLQKQYKDRLVDLKSDISSLPFYKEVEAKTINNLTELLVYEKQCLEQGYEGIITRLPSGHYKCGRATKKSQLLNKFKQFVHFEVEVIGYEEQQSNQNEAEQDAFGRTKRSTKKEGMVAADTLGVFLVKTLEAVVNLQVGDELRVGGGTGLTHALRDEVWTNQDKYLGKIIRAKFQASGAKDKPRFVTFDGFRNEIDMGEPEQVTRKA